MLKILIGALIGVAVGGVGGAVVEVFTGWAGRWFGAKREERKRLKYGDHLAINTGLGIGLDSGGSSIFRVGVEVAPSVSFDAGVALDPVVVAAWVEGVFPGLPPHRQYHDPEDLIRYIDGETVLVINAKGLISLLASVAHHTSGHGLNTKFTLDMSSIVRSIAPLVAAVGNGGFETLYADNLLSQRLDWRFSVSRTISAEAGSVPWTGIDFAGRRPQQNTPGQLPPVAGDRGFGGLAMRNIEIATRSEMVVMTALQSFLERSGYSGLDDCLADLRADVIAALATGRSG